MLPRVKKYVHDIEFNTYIDYNIIYNRYIKYLIIVFVSTINFNFLLLF